MATIDLATLSGTTRPSLFKAVKQPYVVEVTVDIEDVIASKGSALAASDVIEVIDVPAGTLVLNAGLRVDAAMTGTSTDATLDLGITGGDVDQWVDGFDLDAASVGDLSAVAAGATLPTLVSSADTIDLLVATQTGTVLTGKVTVWAELLDLTDSNLSPGRAQLGS